MTDKTPPEVALDEACLAAVPGVVPGAVLGVAVSGGGDSMALLQMLHDLGTFELSVITVDHRLRPESAEEARTVASFCRTLKLPHHTSVWQERAAQGNLSDNARQARKSLISAWAHERGITHVALGHTADDQAETFLMRLSRGSGVQGLSGMETVIEDDGVTWVRPLLHARRADLRAFLSRRNIAWIDDPTNEDARYDRVKMRKVVETLTEAGISVPAITKTTTRLRSAKQVLFTATKDLAQTIVQVTPAGEILIEKERLLSSTSAVRLRLLSEAIRVISGAYYAPRAHSVEGAIEAIDADTGGLTLSGCIIRVKDGQAHLRREPARVAPPTDFGSLWDDRWMIVGASPDKTMIGALGEKGIAQVKNWRDTGYPREVLLTTPAIWLDDELISAPIAGHSANTRAEWRIRNPFFTARHYDH